MLIDNSQLVTSVAGGKGKGAIFRNGNIVKTLPEENLLDEFSRELRKMGIPPEFE